MIDKKCGINDSPLKQQPKAMKPRLKTSAGGKLREKSLNRTESKVKMKLENGSLENLLDAYLKQFATFKSKENKQYKDSSKDKVSKVVSYPKPVRANSNNTAARSISNIQHTNKFTKKETSTKSSVNVASKKPLTKTVQLPITISKDKCANQPIKKTIVQSTQTKSLRKLREKPVEIVYKERKMNKMTEYRLNTIAAKKHLSNLYVKVLTNLA